VEEVQDVHNEELAGLLGQCSVAGAAEPGAPSSSHAPLARSPPLTRMPPPRHLAGVVAAVAAVAAPPPALAPAPAPSTVVALPLTPVAAAPRSRCLLKPLAAAAKKGRRSKRPDAYSPLATVAVGLFSCLWLVLPLAAMCGTPSWRSVDTLSRGSRCSRWRASIPPPRHRGFGWRAAQMCGER